MRRPIVLLLFGMIFVAELGWAGIAPLLPDYQDRFGLSDATTGLILSIAGLGILLVSLPAGALSRRFSVRSLTLWSMAALTFGNVVTGLAGSYGALLAGRCFVGVGLGMMWVTGTAWLHEAAGDRGAQALALTTTVVGLGSLVGPAITGVVGERFGIGVPFVLLGVLCGLTGIALFLAPDDSGRVAEPSPPLRDMLRAARADDLLVTSVLLSLVVSLMWMTVELLVPLRLDGLGYSAAAIGLVFSLSSIVFAVASAVAARGADRYSTLRYSAVWTTVIAVALAAGAFVTSAPGTVVFLLAMGVTSGMMIAITYPLGAIGAREGGFSVAVVGALLNMVWAASGILGPSIGGSISGAVGDAAVFAALAAVSLACAAWIWTRRRDTAQIPDTGAGADTSAG
jgi:DHA1 family inner membrane transport protein